MKKPLIFSLLLSSILSLSSANEINSPIKTVQNMLHEMQKVASLTQDNNKSQTEEAPFNYKLTPKKVDENVWCFFGVLEGPSAQNAGAMSNSCYIKTNDSYVLFDSGPSYEYARQSYEQMKKIAKLPVKAVIISHDHDDHWLGNNFYKEEFNATLIGPSIVNNKYKAGDQTRMFQKLPANAIRGTKIIKLDQTPTEILKLSIGGEEFEIIPVKVKAHTPEDFFLYMPKHNILFSGDLVMNGRVTSNRHGSLKGQLKAIEMIKNKKWNNLIPGHGFITGKTALDEADQYFTQMNEKITKALEEDIELTDINPTEMMKEFKDKAMFNALNGQNVNEAFTELEFSEE